MFRTIRLLTLTLAFGLYALPTSAQIFEIEVTEWNGLDSIPAIKNTVDNAIQEANDEINKEYPSGTQDRMMEGMANSSAMAGKGIGTDYASNMKVFLIGAGAGVAADLEKPKDSDSDLSGIGAAPGVIVGFNLGFMDSKRFLGMDTDRLNLYFNFMSYGFKKELEENEEGEKPVIDVDMLAFGTHMRYDWIRGNGSKLLGWGGVKFTFGFEYNKTKFNIKSQISEDISETVSGTGETIRGTISGNPTATIDAGTMSIPVALSTDVQILYILSLYTGIGADYNMGEATGKGNLNGNSSTLSCTGGACGGGAGTDIVVKPKANLDTTAKVTPFTYRAFAGAQINLPWTRIFAQVDKSLSNEVVAATAGLRFAF